MTREYSQVITDKIWYWDGTVPSDYIVNRLGPGEERYQDKVWRFGKNGTPEGELSGFNVGDRVASNGFHSDIVSRPANLCALIPEDVSDEDAVFTVPGSVALQGIRLANPTLG